MPSSSGSLLKPHTPVSSPTWISYRHLNLSGSDTERFFSLHVFRTPNPRVSFQLPYFPYWHCHLLGWEALGTPFFVAHAFCPISQFIKSGRCSVDMLSCRFLSCPFPVATTLVVQASCNLLEVIFNF